MNTTTITSATLAALVLGGGLIQSGPAAELPEAEKIVVWKRGDYGYDTFRIPSLVVTTKATFLAFAEARKNSRKDLGDIDLMVKRSTDGGKTWSDQILVHEEGDTAIISIGNECSVVDRESGDVIVMFRRYSKEEGVTPAVYVCRSKDDGLTWSKPEEITKSVVPEGATGLNPGPGHGFQLTKGKYAGRICIPSYFVYNREFGEKFGWVHDLMVYSDDGGKTWTRGKPSAKSVGECQAAERADGSIIITSRQYNREYPWRRALLYSEDGGETLSEPDYRGDLPDCNCQGTIVNTTNGSDHILLHANCPGPGEKRNRLTIRLSRDGGKTWPSSRVLHPGPAAYSDLAVLPDGTIGCLYEGGERWRYGTITFARFPLEWMPSE